MSIIESLPIVNLTPVILPSEAYIRDWVNKKFDFRWVWKVYWDLHNNIAGGKCLFRWDSVFSGGTLYPSLNYVRWSLFLIKFQAFRPAALLKRDSNTGISCKICKIFGNTFIQYISGGYFHRIWLGRFIKVPLIKQENSHQHSSDRVCKY